jgi:microsomal dipeptidase-like Zn-dependent dipeptidase
MPLSSLRYQCGRGGTQPFGIGDVGSYPAETRGSIGIWHFFANLDKYFDGITEMAEVVGVDHVSIGTDQHVSPGSVPDYTQWVRLVAAMLSSGGPASSSRTCACGFSESLLAITQPAEPPPIHALLTYLS